MEKHKFNTVKFPVADQLIFHFKNMLFDNLETKFWIAGGALTSFISKEKTNDIDCFVSSREDAAKLIIELRNKFDFKPHLITVNAVKGSILLHNNRISIDIVKRVFKDPVETISEFDFTVSCFAVDDENFYYHPTGVFDIARKKLVINSLPFPVSSVRRMNKYIRKGYSACNGTIMEILTAVRLLEVEDFGLIEFYPID